MIGENIFSPLSIDNIHYSLQHYKTSYIKNYIFAPKIFWDNSTVNRTPIRFFFKTNIADSLASDTSILIKFSGSS